MLKKSLEIVLKHKIIAVVIAILAAGGGYLGYNYFFGAVQDTRYVLAAVEKGTIVSSVSGSGQVSATNQIDVKSKVSGDVARVGVINGREVKAGALLVELDSRDAQKAVRDAEANLESAKLSLEKLKKPADALSILQAENALVQAEESKRNYEDALEKSYDDGFNGVANAFLDLPTVMTGLQDILLGTNFSGGLQWNLDYYADTVKGYDEKVNQYRDDAYNAYQAARKAYDKNFADYKSASRFSGKETIEELINQTYNTSKSVAEAVKSSSNFIQFYQDKLTERNLKPQSFSNTHLASLNVYTGDTNTHLLNLLTIKNDIKNAKENIINADRVIAEKTESIAKLKAGTEPLDVKSQELAIKQKENALLDAKEKLADYFIRVPFAGIVAEINVKIGEPVSANAIIATLITKQRVAEISLNEVDVAKIKVGQKATLVFDAVPDLSIAGKVAEIDVIGAVSQGVVSYGVKITFDTQDERVKPGMSVSASIITDVKTAALIIPNGAVKNKGNGYYIEMFDAEMPESQNSQGVASAEPPRQQPIEIGISNDTQTEIVSGLKEGGRVVVRTVTAAASQTTQQQSPSIFRFGR